MPAVTPMRVIHFCQHLNVYVRFQYASLIHHPFSWFKFASRRHDLGSMAHWESAGLYVQLTQMPVSWQLWEICWSPLHIETLREFLTATNTYKCHKRNKANHAILPSTLKAGWEEEEPTALNDNDHFPSMSVREVLSILAVTLLELVPKDSSRVHKFPSSISRGLRLRWGRQHVKQWQH